MVKEEKTECQFCFAIAVVLDNIDEAGHFNYICLKCGEPQPD